MRNQYLISAPKIVFSKWTRKGYAIFASLKRVVNINRLSVDICDSSLKKNKSILSIINRAITIDYSENDSEEDESLLINWFMLLLIELRLINLEELSSKTQLQIGTIQGSYFAQCRMWTFFMSKNYGRKV